jgi:hypothetical protein
MSCSPETRAFLAGRTDLLETIARRHAGRFAAFGSSLFVREGRMALPGGPRKDGFWHDLMGESPGDPAAFIERVLGRDHGRRAWFLDVIAQLQPATQHFVLGPPHSVARAPAESWAASAEALADLLQSHEPRWDADDRPFARPPIDAHVVLEALRVTESGAWVGPSSQRFWRDVFDGRDPGEDLGAWHRSVAAAPPVDAAFLVGSVVGADLERSIARLGAVRFVQRRLADARPDQLADVRSAAHALITAPALVLVLERIGLFEPREYASVAKGAEAISRVARNAGSPMALAQFQATLAIVDGLHTRRAISTDTARHLVDSLSDLEPDPEGYGPALASWLRAHLFPALSTGEAAVHDEDAALIRALAGPQAGLTAPAVTWEGLRYRFDPASAETRRLESVVGLQRAPPLASALAFADAVRAFTTVGSGATKEHRRALEEHAERLGFIRRSLFGTDPVSLSAATLIAPVLERAGTDDGEPLRARDRRTLRAVAEGALTEALLAYCYARHLGNPQGPLSLVPDVARRHQLDPDDPGRRIGARTAWQPPESRSGGEGGGWRVAGSLLMLEHALAELALQPIDTSALPEPPRLSEAGQALLALSAFLMDPWAMDDRVADELVSQVAQARERMRSSCVPPDEGRTVWRQWRLATAQWACVHDPESVERLWTLTDLALAAEGKESTTGLDPFGGLDPVLEGPLAPRWLSGRPLDDREGRPATARVVAPFVELTLRILPVLRAHGLPAGLLPAVVSTAMFDLLHDARLAYPDDWFRLARYAAELSDEQIEDYVAAQASRGPLVPVAQDR